MANSASRFPRVTGPVLSALWLVTFVLGYFAIGSWLAEAIEGQDRSRLAVGPLVVAGLALVTSLAMSVLWARGLESPASSEGASPTRRRFLLGTATVFGGLVGTVAAVLGRNSGWLTVTGPALSPSLPFEADTPETAWQGARVREYRRLGRTDFQVSDISLGSGRIKEEQGERVARAAIERGINYFDTAPDYSEAGSETALGKAIQGHRDKMFLATKFCTPQGNLPAGTSVAHYMEAIDESLRRLRTDYVDLVHIHSCDTLERLLDENAHEAFDRLKEQGKVRFLGFSSHTPNLEAVADAAIESNRFDVMMLAYHHGAWPRLAEVIERARKIDMGIVAMKTLKGAYHRGLLDNRAEADSYTQAAFKWVLNNSDVSCLVISFRDMSNLDEYLYASGQRPSSPDYAILRKYEERIAGVHCYAHCGDCLDACPEGLPIDDVLRYRMYFENYGEEKEAMRLYAKLEKQADVCVGCSAPCNGVCPVGITIQQRTTEAHRLLALV